MYYLMLLASMMWRSQNWALVGCVDRIGGVQRSAGGRSARVVSGLVYAMLLLEIGRAHV